MPRPGGRPALAVNAATAGMTSARIWLATAVPSRTLAVMKGSYGGGRGFRLQPLQRVGRTEDDQLVARADRGFGLRVDIHPPVLALDADDDHAVALAQVCVQDRRIGERR